MTLLLCDLAGAAVDRSSAAASTPVSRQTKEVAVQTQAARAAAPPEPLQPAPSAPSAPPSVPAGDSISSVGESVESAPDGFAPCEDGGFVRNTPAAPASPPAPLPPPLDSRTHARRTPPHARTHARTPRRGRERTARTAAMDFPVVSEQQLEGWFPTEHGSEGGTVLQAEREHLGSSRGRSRWRLLRQGLRQGLRSAARANADTAEVAL